MWQSYQIYMSLLGLITFPFLEKRILYFLHDEGNC